MTALQRAIATRRQVRIDYLGSRGRTAVEAVPVVVGSRGVRWYLLAAPAVRGIADVERLRTYRVDRIEAITVVDDPGAPPDDFDSTAAWQSMVADVEELRGRVRAVIRAEPWAVRAVCDRFGRQARVIDDDGCLIEVRAHRTDALAEQLAGWTSAVEVIEPPAIRIALRELGERLIERYRTREPQIR